MEVHQQNELHISLQLQQIQADFQRQAHDAHEAKQRFDLQSSELDQQIRQFSLLKKENSLQKTEISQLETKMSQLYAKMNQEIAENNEIQKQMQKMTKLERDQDVKNELIRKLRENQK